jgi:hypothetical protein
MIELITPPLLLLRRDPQWVEDLANTFAPDEVDPFSRIRCPRCGWKPSASCRWSCVRGLDNPEPFFVGCGTVWNTFLTHGRCPGCAHQWRWTSCLSCQEWSPHEDWYEDQPTD